jgi:hypothetical protein
VSRLPVPGRKLLLEVAVTAKTQTAQISGKAAFVNQREEETKAGLSPQNETSAAVICPLECKRVSLLRTND